MSVVVPLQFGASFNVRYTLVVAASREFGLGSQCVCVCVAVRNGARRVATSAKLSSRSAWRVVAFPDVGVVDVVVVGSMSTI